MSRDSLLDVRMDMRTVQDKFNKALAKWCKISDKVKDASNRYRAAKDSCNTLSQFFARVEFKTLQSTKNIYYRYIKRQAKLLDKLGERAYRIETERRRFLTSALSESSISSSDSVFSIPGMIDVEVLDSDESVEYAEPSIVLGQCPATYLDRLSQ